jgi:hypothetical protein
MNAEVDTVLKIVRNFPKSIIKTHFCDISVHIVLFPKEANESTPENRKARRQKSAHSIISSRILCSVQQEADIAR